MTWTYYSLEAPAERPLLNALEDLIPPAPGVTYRLGTQDVGDYVVIVAGRVGYGDWEFDANGNITKTETLGRFYADIAVGEGSSADLSALEADNGWATVTRPPHPHAASRFGATNSSRRTKSFTGPVSVLESIGHPKHRF